MEATISDSEKKNLTTTLSHKDWSSIPRDIVSCFTRQIVSLKDLYSFGGVCKLWREEAFDAKSRNSSMSLQHKVPILLLPKQYEAPFYDIYSLTESKIYHLNLPETKDKFCLSSLGWLLLATKYKDDEHRKLELFNPLTHAHIELPSLPRELFNFYYMKKFVLSSSPSSTSEYDVMLLSFDSLVVYKSGYNSNMWTRVHIPKKLRSGLTLVDGAYHKGHYYVVDFVASILICEIKDSNKPPHMRLKLVVPHIPSPLFKFERKLYARYLIEFAGTLFLVMIDIDDNDVTRDYKVMEVPTDSGKSWVKSQVVKSFGNKTMFLGVNNSSFWIESLDDSVCQANCIYFLNESVISESGDMDTGIYYMNKEKVEPLLEPFPRFKSLKSHSWLQPSF